MATWRLYHVLDAKEDNYLCPNGGEVLHTDNDEFVCPVCGGRTGFTRQELIRAPQKPDGFAIMRNGKCIQYVQVHMQFTADRIANDLNGEAVQLPY